MVLIRAKGGWTGFARAMAALALFAVLALVLLPTSGRLAGQVPGGPAPSVSAAGEMAGHAHDHGHGHDAGHEAAHGHAAGSPDAGGPGEAPDSPRPAPHEGHADCAYCPLLASVLPVAVLPLPPATGREHDRWYPPLRTARLGYLHPCGLGSRGPPLS